MTRHRFARVAVVLVAGLSLASCMPADVGRLASDAFDGRNNNTPGSFAAQDFLLGYLQQWTVGANAAATGIDAYKQPFVSGSTVGTNLVGALPGSDLADEYVLVGAHYDHLGHSCRDLRPNDVVCNGATDNAAGVAEVVQLARMFAALDHPPRRSIVFAFWDGEEDGLRGSQFYVAHPLVPLAQTVAYVNFDIQGANLRPSLRNVSFAVGAETGGARLRELVDDAIAPGTLDTRQLSAIFGQGRSDYVSFIAASVPTVFFSDATGPCYHTDSDDTAVVDFAKLAQQARISYRLVDALASTDSLPTFSGNPLATYGDAAVLTDIIDELQADFAMFSQEQQSALVGFRNQLHAIVDAGEPAFDSADISTILSIAATVVGYFTSGPCSGFVASP